MRPIRLDRIERLFYPVVPVVITAESDGRVGGMLAAWWTQLSFSPFLVGVAIAPERYTYRLVEDAKAFGLNFLDFKYVDKMPYLGDVSERFLKDKIRKAGFTVIKGKVLGVPLLKEAAAAVEAKLVKIYEVGDHDFFVGEVKAAYAIDDFDEMWKLESYKPLMYLGRTKRPAPVYRVYVTAKGFEKRRFDFAAGILRKYHEMRLRVKEVMFDVIRKHKDATMEEVMKVLVEIARRYGLDRRDAELYLREARKAGLMG